MPKHTIFELRNYTLRPGPRDVLIDLYEREPIESQETLGIRVVANVRDLDIGDHFAWLRSFADLAARAEPLSASYNGSVWQACREIANATMLGSDNVLLLHSVKIDLPWAEPRPHIGSSAPPLSLFVATAYSCTPATIMTSPIITSGPSCGALARAQSPHLRRNIAKTISRDCQRARSKMYWSCCSGSITSQLTGHNLLRSTLRGNGRSLSRRNCSAFSSPPSGLAPSADLGTALSVHFPG